MRVKEVNSGRRRVFLIASVFACAIAVFALFRPEDALVRVQRWNGDAARREAPARSQVSVRSEAPARRVILISIDGFAARLLERAELPAIRRLMAEGVAAERAVTVLPSKTLPAHASMLSGVPPSEHGITSNQYDPQLKWEQRNLYTLCREHALRCGLFGAKDKLLVLVENEPGCEQYEIHESAADVFKAAAAYIKDRDPDFVMIHLAEVDLVGHDIGWDSPKQVRALKKIDRLLGKFLPRLQAASERPLAVILTADHGGHGKNHGTDSPEDMRIPWILWGAKLAGRTKIEQFSLAETAPIIRELLEVVE